MPLDFPNSPNVNDTYTSDNKTWKWNGTSWGIISSGIVGPTGPTGPAGDWSTAQLVSEKIASYTAEASDAGKIILFNSGSAVNYNVNSGLGVTAGKSIDILQKGGGQVTVVAGSGVTINATPGLKLRARYSSATLISIGTNEFILVGDLIA